MTEPRPPLPEPDDRLPTLRGARIVVRWMTHDDLDALLGVWGAPAAMVYMARPPLRDLAETRAFLDEIHTGFADGTLHQWGIALAPDDRVIGTVTLAAIDRQHQRAEIGFVLHPDHWRRGYMSEALPLVLDHAFGDLALHRIEADVDPRNTGSLHLLENLGFTREGYLRERYFQNDEIQDAVMFGLLARDWTARREGTSPKS